MGWKIRKWLGRGIPGKIEIVGEFSWGCGYISAAQNIE